MRLACTTQRSVGCAHGPILGFAENTRIIC